MIFAGALACRRINQGTRPWTTNTTARPITTSGKATPNRAVTNPVTIADIALSAAAFPMDAGTRSEAIGAPELFATRAATGGAVTTGGAVGKDTPPYKVKTRGFTRSHFAWAKLGPCHNRTEPLTCNSCHDPPAAFSSRIPRI